MNKLIGSLFMLLGVFVGFLSPIVGIIVTGNWWLILLYIFTYIPGLIMLQLGAGIYDL